MKKAPVLFFLLLVLSVQTSAVRALQLQTVTVSIKENSTGPVLSDRYLGLSYEMSAVLPVNGRYYFDAHDRALIQTFRTLGIKSLRVGANAVDNPKFSVPQEKDIDELFDFARAAGVKVIYSFRLKNGNPADSARLASYIEAHYADTLDSFSIGNEPDDFLPSFDAYFGLWKKHYDAILHAAPQARFDGPSVGPAYSWTLNLANALYRAGHLSMVSNHYYFLGNGRDAERDPVSARDRFLSNSLQATYQQSYDNLGRILASQGVPYRIDETNNCWAGGARNSSDTYASTLWALDYTHWWASRHILGINYHTADRMEKNETYSGNNYASFVHLPGDSGIAMRPQAYAYLTFTQGAHGRPLPLDVYGDWTFNFNAYAYQDLDGSFYVTLINKSYGDKAQSASVLLLLPPAKGGGTWQRMDLINQEQRITAKTDITLGGASIDAAGTWSGGWKQIGEIDSNKLRIQVPPTSATILRFKTAP